jgi:type IV secretory pathway protease TraF
VAFGTLTGNLITVPAGAQIVSVVFVTTTVFSAATTCALSIGGTAFTTAATVTSVGSHNLNASTSTPAGWVNVGATDATIAYTLVGAGLSTGAGTIIVNYSVRNSDGGQFQTTFNN